MKVASIQEGLTVRSRVPSFKYRFKKADEPVEMPPEHAKKVLMNHTFYEFGKSSKKVKKTKEENE